MNTTSKTPSDTPTDMPLTSLADTPAGTRTASSSASSASAPVRNRFQIVLVVAGLLLTIGLALTAVAVWGDSNTAPARTPNELVADGVSAQLDGDLEAAETLYRRALTIEPGNVLALYNLGVVKQSQQAPDEAVDLFRRALAIDAEMSSARLNLAWALRDLGQIDEAVAELIDLRERRPDDAVVLFNLGQMLIAAGEVDEGAELVSEAIELDESLLVTE